jgi:uncharacterized protein
MNNDNKFKTDKIVASAIFAVGITLAGYFIGNSFLKARLQDRHVTVKGLSEREVTADLAIWRITIKAVGNDLTEVNNKIISDRNALSEFLIKQGFKEEEIEIGDHFVTDLLANQYGDKSAKNSRYIINATTILKTHSVDKVRKATHLRSILVEKGIVIEDYGPSYVFTKFNDLKPEMLEEAIKNARKSANKFAEDSASKLGALKRANQGIFLIGPAVGSEEDDEYNNKYAARLSISKKIRLVTTLEYFLKE